MQSIKKTKNILNRLNELDIKTMLINKPRLVLIVSDKKGWLIREYYNNSKYRESIYDDYTEYLNNKNLDKQTSIIINDLPKDV